MLPEQCKGVHITYFDMIVLTLNFAVTGVSTTKLEHETDTSEQDMNCVPVT